MNRITSKFRCVSRLATFALAVGLFSSLFCHVKCTVGAQPNILWLTNEDMSPYLGCYGDPDAVTPNIDALAARSLKFAHVWSNAPVCAPARTGLISGVYPTSVGAHDMRSDVAIPSNIQVLPQLMRKAGYYCTNYSKTDYNGIAADTVWNECSKKAHWKNRPQGQPFFAAFNFTQSHESNALLEKPKLQHDPQKITLPPYHPDTPEVRRERARYYDNITRIDEMIGRCLAELEDAGLADDTIIFYFSDHGTGLPRSKRTPLNSGLQVPLIIHVPEKWQHLAPEDYQPGGTSSRLVSFIDFAPTLLSIIGEKPHAWMQGTAFMGEHAGKPHTHLFGFRGRMDERYDCVRSATNGRYVYLRNYMPHLSHAQHVRTMFKQRTAQIWKQRFDENALTAVQASFWQPRRPEELYDLQADPYETVNLAEDPAHQPLLEEFRRAQREHLLTIHDIGFLPEAEMHRRAQAANTTIGEVARDAQFYSMAEVLETAERASSLSPNDFDALRSRLVHSDPGVRYWAVMGLLMRGDSTIDANVSALRTALEDSNESVQIVAAHALLLRGNAQDQASALAVLKQQITLQAENPYISIAALNVVDVIGRRATPLRRQIQTIASTRSSQLGHGYSQRLAEKILTNLN
jgi:arylsulfatase A-like enzyme